MSDQRTRLANETSPYLLQHRDNPVHWWGWSEGALTAAYEANKPVLLSVGYAACHWCHVMAHESFEDLAIAKLMNALFVNIKIDREERPDIGFIYQSALQIMGQQGGWPLTMFLTSKGEPFWGGTYFPPTNRFGRPGFPEVLRSVASAFQTQDKQININTASLVTGLEKISKPEGGGEININLLDAVATLALRAVDPMNGSTMGAPKFPQPTFFQYLWRAYRRHRSPMFSNAVTLTPDQICQGGIYDHLGGGFARYSTDKIWLVPHFEKMLYDNALLIELLSEVWLEAGSALYEARVHETIAWALRELRTDGGHPAAFVSAYDADSEREEGKFYVWNENEIDTLLGETAALFKQIYDVSPHGNWEGRVILNRSADLTLGDEMQEASLAKARAILLKAHTNRIWPRRDDKVPADWLIAAKDAFAFVCDRMEENGRLYHSWCAGEARHHGVLEDYASMARGALALHEATGDDTYLFRARGWTAVTDAHFWDEADGGYFMSADDTTDILVRPKPIHDNATPSGNGMMAEVLAHLYFLSGDASFRSQLDALVLALVPGETEQAVHQLSLLMGFETVDQAAQIVVAGVSSSDSQLPSGLVRDALLNAPPAHILIRLGDDVSLPIGHPAYGKTAIDNKPTAYICVGKTCTLPLTDSESLKKALSEL